MANRTRQVQGKRPSKELKRSSLSHDLAKLEAEARAALEAQIETEGYPVFLRPDPDRRCYPGEAEAVHILREIIMHSELRPNAKKLDAVLKPIRILQLVEATNSSGDTVAIMRARRAGLVVWKNLERIISSDRVFVHLRQGVPVIDPETTEGLTAFALLSLYLTGKLDRLKQCKQCEWWFYARFKHQQFCNDPMKKCQWNHYHTPEWRKKHREQNQRHQAAYRQRMVPKYPVV